VVLALARAMTGRPRPPLVAHLLALAVDVTWATNSVGADLEIAGLLVAAGFAAYGWRHRADMRLVMLFAFVPSALWLVASLVA
jgi:membrane associated rhomboid family serine protease